MAQQKFSLILLEAECNDTPIALTRISFWEKCGFELLGDYIHHYIWVPEPYQAMRFVLQQDSAIPATGKELFAYIVLFHKESFYRNTSKEKYTKGFLRKRSGF
jgi:hypothetical protein